jgi:hypothetical protein
MKNRQFDLSYFSPKVEKRASRIDGRGLFANQAIKMGEIVVVKGGYVLTRAQRDQIGRELGSAEIQIIDDLLIGPVTKRQREGGMMHLNHLCEPNLSLQGQVVFLSLRDIEADEELTFDYATDDEPYEMKCQCGMPNSAARSPALIGSSPRSRTSMTAISRGLFSGGSMPSREKRRDDWRCTGTCRSPIWVRRLVLDSDRPTKAY